MTESHQEQQHQQEQEQSQQHPHQQEVSGAATDVIVPEGAAVTAVPGLEPEEQEQTALKSLSTPAAIVVTPVKPSRLSLAFQSISCGLCFNPLKINNPTDYHTLVVTPTDEDGPILGEDYHGTEDGFAPKVITEDYKEGHNNDVGASSSTEHRLSSQGDHEEIHHEDKHKETSSKDEVTSTFIEEITIVEGSGESAEIIDREIHEETVPFVIPQEQEKQLPSAAVIAAPVVPAPVPVVAATSPSTPPTRSSSRPFARLTKRSSSGSNMPPSPSSSSPSSSPLLGRLSRFAKIIRPSETSSSLQSKVDSLQVTEPAMVETDLKKKSKKATTPAAVATTDTGVVDLRELAAVAAAVEAKQDYRVEIHETVMSDDEEDALTEEPKELEWSLAPSRQMPLVVNTSVSSTSSQPVAIPGQSPKSPLHAWAQSPTLHQSAASSGSGQSLAKAGRSSTVGSTIGGSEAGSLGSNVDLNNSAAASSLGKDKDSLDNKKRRNSMLKKIGNIIKNTKDKKSSDKAEKRLSRQGSTTMTSPIEADEDARF